MTIACANRSPESPFSSLCAESSDDRFLPDDRAMAGEDQGATDDQHGRDERMVESRPLVKSLHRGLVRCRYIPHKALRNHA